MISGRSTAIHVVSEGAKLLITASDKYARRRLLLALFLVFVGALLASCAPIPLKEVLDALAASHTEAVLVSSATLVALHVSLQLLSRLATEWRTLVFAEAEQRLRRRISGVLFAHVISLPMRSHLEKKVGAIGETAEQGIRGYQLLLTQLVYTVLPVVVELGIGGVVLIYFGNAKYLTILALSAVAHLVVFRRGSMDMRSPAQAASEHHIEARGVMTDAVMNFETIKYFAAEGATCARYDGAMAQTEGAWRTFIHRRGKNGAAVATIFAASLATALLWATYDVVAGAMTIGGFVLVNTYVLRLVQPFEMLGLAVRDIAQGAAFLNKMLELLRESSEGNELVEGEFPRHGRGELTFSCVSFSYTSERSVLNDVTFSIPPGKTVAVVGASGAGKSSLIRLLFRLYEPASGTILLDGVPIDRMPLSSVRQAISVVPQDTVLFHDSISKNIGFGKYGASQWEIEEAARVANLHEFITGLPEGYETMVGERGLKLSGGERQRVAIARAVLKQPRILVFDEATSSLDAVTEREILKSLRDASRGMTRLVIAHRMSTIIDADEIVVLEQGSVVERGTHSELLKINRNYAALWRAQAHESHQDIVQKSSVA